MQYPFRTNTFILLVSSFKKILIVRCDQKLNNNEIVKKIKKCISVYLGVSCLGSCLTNYSMVLKKINQLVELIESVLKLMVNRGRTAI